MLFDDIELKCLLLSNLEVIGYPRSWCMTLFSSLIWFNTWKKENTPTVPKQTNQQDGGGPVEATVTESDLKVSVERELVSQAEEEDMEALLGT